MAIPSTQPFEDVLGSIRLAEVMPSQGGAKRLPSIPAQDETGRVTRDRPLWLTFREEGPLGFGSLVTKVMKELGAAGHTATEELALFTLALAFLVPAAKGAAVERLNRLLSRMVRADVSLYLVFPLSVPPEFAVTIPPFYVGPTRVEKLKYRCERTGSDYYARYSNTLKGTSCIERAPKSVTILDVDYVQTDLFVDAFKVDAQALLPRLTAILDGYFGFLNGRFFEDFLLEFVARQDVTVSLGAPFVDPGPLRGVISYQQIAIFMNYGKYGFVAPRGPGPVHVDWANAHVRIPQALHELQDTFGYRGTEDAPVYKTLQLYCSFVARAKRHCIAGRLDEALLHAVIAIELVFAEREAVQRSVTERVSVLTHAAVGRTFIEHKKWIEGVYDIRSKYVHAGSSDVQESQLEQLFDLCALITRRLLRAAAGIGSKPEALGAWLADLDYLAKAYLASRTPRASDLAAAFLDPERDFTLEAAATTEH
jgi:hypothetical protein